jgi:hypothetical protein
MSYNTAFALSIIACRTQSPSCTHRHGSADLYCAECSVKVDDVAALNRAVVILEAMNDGYNVLDEPCFWDEHEEHMREVSTQMPNFVFALYGTCDDYHERWVKYFRAGQMQVEDAVIIYPEVNQAKLR